MERTLRHVKQSAKLNLAAIGERTSKLKIADLFVDASHVGHHIKAQEFSEPFDDQLENWWRECPCGSWLMWVAAKLGGDPLLLVAAACDCARQSIRFLPDDERRPVSVIEVAERWTRNLATADECRNAADQIPDIQSEIGERLQSDPDSTLPGVNTAAAMLAAAATEMPANAAAFAHDPGWFANFVSQAASRAAAAARNVGGEKDWWTMQEVCANLVRDKLPAPKV